ncbi:Holliday junction endonuclease [Streptomyces sp. NBC_01763]|uniref:Holliday junction endonuclease n=1 Tax=Streptomyces sp. NBC_01763 TaxID=2975934 RepID=UPI002DD9468E|nr:Holliday junction endonuclease [Streptomyces sp. NBC_01763]WSC35674.1 Holliday junction endonuclease [Streptomyces sp. NBC_01763]
METFPLFEPEAVKPLPSVVAFDLSLTASGICYRDGSTTTVKTRTADGDRRLLQIAEAARMAVGGEHLGLGPAPDLVVMEDIPQNSFAAKPISMVHGVVRAVLIEAGAPYALVTAATLKAYATGKGSGDKVPMAMAAYKRAGREFLDDNQCDAWWLWVAGLDHLGISTVELPKAQRDRLDKVNWPEVTR